MHPFGISARYMNQALDIAYIGSGSSVHSRLLGIFMFECGETGNARVLLQLCTKGSDSAHRFKLGR